MVFDVLALTLFVGGGYAFWQEGRLARAMLPPEDQPPKAARAPMPRHARMGGYVASGLDSIDDFLAGPDHDRQPDAGRHRDGDQGRDQDQHPDQHRDRHPDRGQDWDRDQPV